MMLALAVSLLPIALALAYLRASLALWAVLGAAWLAATAWLAGWSVGVSAAAAAVYAAAMALLLVAPLRRRLITGPVFRIYRRILPQMSQTEREALEAGTVWWEGELFNGRPDWAKLLAFPVPRLTEEERAFLDDETERLCAMVSEWETTQRARDLPPHVWQFIEDKGFLGLIIPKRYGGKQFSAFAHSQIVMKLASRCSAAAVTVMVPNSLGPAELLLHYGTEEQKNRYLPRLARGLEIPCFALTSPHAGSDAASIPDRGVVCKGQWEGREILGMRVTWDKRYITLAPVASLLGLAFRLYDPDHLLGEVEDIGITCALVPTSHPGVEIGRRHMPLNAGFQNGPTRGRDVFMPLDWIIGGSAMAGQGWRMLMESLAAGRSISLPSGSTGMAKLAVRATGAYARVRSQFKTAIGRFEGIQEPLARMGGNLYLMDAARSMTAGAVDQGEKPSVVSAIVKYHVTERGRQIINDAMDIVGGKGICMGPSNFLGSAYMQMPIGITVEGANILTRSLIIFGQGAIRAHPCVLREMRAAQDSDRARGLREFDAALRSHVALAASNGARAFVMGLTGSHFVRVPAGVAPETRRYYQQLTRFSAAFSYLADLAMVSLGGDLKRKEKLSARMGDVLSMLYLASAVLKRYESEGRQAADAPFMHWAIWDAMYRAQNAFEGVISNFPVGAVAKWLHFVIFPLGRPYVVPSDRLGAELAQRLIEPGAVRDRLTAGMYVPREEAEALGALELALASAVAAEPVEAKIRAALKAGRLAIGAGEDAAEAARVAGIISAAERSLLARRDALRDRVIGVDDFPPDLGTAAQATQGPRRAAA